MTITAPAGVAIQVAGAACAPTAGQPNVVVCTVTAGATLTVTLAGVQRAPVAVPVAAPAAAPATAPVAAVRPATQVAVAPAALPRTGVGVNADNATSMGLLSGIGALLLLGGSGLALVRRRKDD